MDGTILELTSRGKKDAYFIQDPQRSFFGKEYNRRSVSCKEIRFQFPNSPAVFGDTVDIEIPHYGDIISRVDITIDLPTWFPTEELVKINKEANFSVYSSWNPPALPNGITAPAGTPLETVDLSNPAATAAPALVGYGYVSGVADMIFSKWELYADNYKICEGYPSEFSSWYPYSQSTFNKIPVGYQRSAYTNETAYEVTGNATPSTLVCSIPIPGCQRADDVGFPICAVHNQKLLLRFFLQPLQKLVQSTPYYDSSGFPILVNGQPIYDPCPAPWGRRPLWIYDISNNTSTFAGFSIPLQLIDFPYIAARFTVLHVDDEARRDLQSRHLELFYQKQYVEPLIFDTRNWFIGAQISRTFEIKGFFESLVLQFVAESRIKENRYSDQLPPQVYSRTPKEWFTEASLILNNRERIQPWEPRTLRILSNNLQFPCDVVDTQYYFVFGRHYDHEPGGNLLLTRSHKVRLNFTVAVAPNDPAVASGQVNLIMLGIAWNVLDISDSLAKVRYPD